MTITIDDTALYAIQYELDRAHETALVAYEQAMSSPNVGGRKALNREIAYYAARDLADALRSAIQAALRAQTTTATP